MNKVIIVGATTGIGYELAILYAQKNWLVGATGRRKDLLQNLQQQFPENIVTECFDVIGNENIESIKNLSQQLGGLDLLIYNSGFGEVSQELNWEIDKLTTLTNVNGFIEIVNYAFNYFKVEGQGHIAATSSIAAIRGGSYSPAYNASKAFISTYMEGLYIKAAKLKLPLYVTDIQPGFVKTAMAKSDDQFWIAPVAKAAEQIYKGIANKKRKVYVTKRWRVVAVLMQIIPIGIYKRFG